MPVLHCPSGRAGGPYERPVSPGVVCLLLVAQRLRGNTSKWLEATRLTMPGVYVRYQPRAFFLSALFHHQSLVPNTECSTHYSYFVPNVHMLAHCGSIHPNPLDDGSVSLCRAHHESKQSTFYYILTGLYHDRVPPQQQYCKGGRNTWTLALRAKFTCDAITAAGLIVSDL